MRTALAVLVFACSAFGDDLLVGYRARNLAYQGPGEWRQSVEPVWVYAYHKLRISYRASGLEKNGAPILILRPGSVGPVTPGATNPENPFVAGTPVVVVVARDLVADGALHSLDIELRGKMRTPQVDQLIFSLPAGVRLTVEDLQFLAAPDIFPCAAGGPALPAGAAALATRGPATCAGAPATTLRGRESIHIEGAGRRGGTLYLSLVAHFAAATGYGWEESPDRARMAESSETADVLARIVYADGKEEEQFPALAAERRHALLNRRPALYVLTLDASRAIRSVEIEDRSPHAQLALFAAGIAKTTPPPAIDELILPAPRHRAGEPKVDAVPGYRMTAPAGAVRAELRMSPSTGARTLALSLTNVSAAPQEFRLTFPALSIEPAADASDVWYVFPRQGAVIANTDQSLVAGYNASFPLQFVDVFAPAAGRGACVIIRDTDGRAKQFSMMKSGARTSVEVEYTVRLAPGETFRPPDAQLIPHGGDWREGFEAYRNWVRSWYKPKGPRPAWLHAAFWARRDYPVGGSGRLFDVRANRYTFDELIRDGEAFGGIDFIDISGWAMSNTVGRVGDYPIELGGPADLRRNIAVGEKAHIPTGLYFEGYLIDKNSRVGAHSGAAWQMIDEKGQGRWWAGGSPELFVCPYVADWQTYLAGRASAVAHDVGAAGIYLDEYGFGRQRCYSAAHGHPPGVETLPGEIAMTKKVRNALDAAGMRRTFLYIEETPPDAAAPYYDAAFCYNLPFANRTTSPLKLNLWRFVFPDIRLWDMVSIGIHPRQLPSEDFRLSLWHANGLWLKGHSATWYGENLLAFIRRARGLLKQHAEAFAGQADPLVASPHPAVFINRFQGGGETVYTLFNASYRTARYRFEGRERVLGPRDVDVVVAPEKR